jgi:hypothetical protein
MDPEANGDPTIGGAVALEAIPPIRGDDSFFLVNEGGAVMFDLDGPSSRPSDESSMVVASRSQPLLSQPTTHGGFFYGHNLPWYIAAMLRVSPQSAGSAFGYIYLAVDERIHQDPLINVSIGRGCAVA